MKEHGRRLLIVLAVLALGALWTGAPSLAQEAETTTYTVQPGDTLYRLSQRFETTVARLVELNDIENPDLIYVGQALRVPATGGGAAGQTPPRTPQPTGGPLSFEWARVNVQYEGRDYVSTLRIEATGGQPPYTYYHDRLVQEGPTFEVLWRRGRNKPGSVGVEDATGTYVEQEYWLKDPCNYPGPGVVITEPDEDEVLRHDPRNFNIEWEHPDAPPDAYWIEIQVWEDGWEPFETYFHERGDSELFFVPDPFPGDLDGRLRMWGVYGECEVQEKTPWRNFKFRAGD